MNPVTTAAGNRHWLAVAGGEAAPLGQWITDGLRRT